MAFVGFETQLVDSQLNQTPENNSCPACGQGDFLSSFEQMSSSSFKITLAVLIKIITDRNNNTRPFDIK